MMNTPRRPNDKENEDENILTKSLGSNTPANVVKATVNGLKRLRTVSQVAKLRNKSVAEITGREEVNEA